MKKQFTSPKIRVIKAQTMSILAGSDAASGATINVLTVADNDNSVVF